MRRITIKRARTWRYRKMHPCIEQSNGLASLSPFLSWPYCIIDTSGYDFRKRQVSKNQDFPPQAALSTGAALSARMPAISAQLQSLVERPNLPWLRHMKKGPEEIPGFRHVRSRVGLINSPYRPC